MIAKALRYDARLSRVEGNEIQFITSEMMKKKFEQPKPRATINHVFSRLLGSSVVVRFLSDNDAASVAPGPSAEAVDRSEQAADETGETLLKIVTEEFGGTIAE